MGKVGLELLNTVPFQRLSSTICDNYVSQQVSRNENAGIASVVPLITETSKQLNYHLQIIIIISSLALAWSEKMHDSRYNFYLFFLAI